MLKTNNLDQNKVHRPLPTNLEIASEDDRDNRLKNFTNIPDLC